MFLQIVKRQKENIKKCTEIYNSKNGLWKLEHRAALAKESQIKRTFIVTFDAVVNCNSPELSTVSNRHLPLRRAFIM